MELSSQSRMEPILLVQTRVPGGVGKSQNGGKGMGRTNVNKCEHTDGKRQLGFTQMVSTNPRQV